MPADSMNRIRALALAIGTALVAATSLLAQGSGAAPRIAPVPEAERSDEQRAIASRFAASGMTNAIATYLHYPTLAPSLR